MRVILIIALALGLAACGASTAPANSNAAGASADGPMSLAAVAFVRRTLTDANGTENARAPPLRSVIEENGRLFNEELMVIAYDPICQCQDTMEEPIDFAAMPDGPNRFTVRVRDPQNPAREPWTLITVFENGAWGITDVIEPETGSFVERIGRMNACARARQAQGQSTDVCAEGS